VNINYDNKNIKVRFSTIGQMRASKYITAWKRLWNSWVVPPVWM